MNFCAIRCWLMDDRAARPLKAHTLRKGSLEKRLRLQRGIDVLVNTSLSRVWRFVRHPWRIRMAFYERSVASNNQALSWLFPQLREEEIEACRLDFLRNHRFFTELNTRLVEKRHRRFVPGWREFVYMAVRFARPKMVLETGVFDGESSAVILQALTDNREGELLSVDLPAVDTIHRSTSGMRETVLPPGLSPGWVIPDPLRHRHRLELGDSRELLPEILQSLQSVDIFLHDSLHTFDHMSFEYSTAWAHLRDGGLLLSDDILWNSAFHSFCRPLNRKYVRIGGFGAVRK